MDLFEHRYYRLSKTIMRLIGQWPYQSIRARRGLLAVSFFLNTSGIVPMVLPYVKYHDGRRVVLDSIAIYIAAMQSVIKYIIIVWNSEKTLMLLNRICTNWQVWAQHREIKILHKYAERGEKIIIVYTVLVYFSVITFMTQPIIPKFIDVIFMNGTEPAKFPFPVDYYFFDAQKYYCYVMVHLYVCTCFGTIPVVASDTMLIIYVQHVCGVFAALRHQSKRIGNSNTSMGNVAQLRSFIQRHNDSIEYANLIKATYTWNFLFIIGLGVILINLIGLQILVRTNDPESAIRFIVVLFTTGFVFYVDCYISQILMDHSVNVGLSIYNSQWYRLLPSDRKPVQLIILRCHVPCQITAGKILIMSMRNWGLTLRTSMSYFVFIQRMREKQYCVT